MEWQKVKLPERWGDKEYKGLRMCPICKEPFGKSDVIERFKCCPCCGVFLELSEEDKKEKKKRLKEDERWIL